MDDRFDKFIQEIEIDEKDIPRAKKFVESKGIEKHLLIKRYLMSWSADKRIRYTQIATTYRYDKRIRMVLFKYISYLEEFYRGIILDYANKTKNITWNHDVKEILEAYKCDVNRALERIEFSQLLRQCRRMPKLAQKTMLIAEREHLKKNMDAVVELRNAVMHNKFLLLYKDFNRCYVNDLSSSSLKNNIKNLIAFLPNEVGEKCIKEINGCAIDTNNYDDTAWDLLETLCIEIQY